MSPTDGASLSGIAEGADGMAMERVVTLIRPVVVFPSQKDHRRLFDVGCRASPVVVDQLSTAMGLFGNRQ